MEVAIHRKSHFGMQNNVRLQSMLDYRGFTVMI